MSYGINKSYWLFNQVMSVENNVTNYYANAKWADLRSTYMCNNVFWIMQRDFCGNLEVLCVNRFLIFQQVTYCYISFFHDFAQVLKLSVMQKIWAIKYMWYFFRRITFLIVTINCCCCKYVFKVFHCFFCLLSDFFWARVNFAIFLTCLFCSF